MTVHAPLANTSSLRPPVTLAASLGQTSRGNRTTKDHADVTALAGLGSLWEEERKEGSVGRQKRVIWRERDSLHHKRPRKPFRPSIPRPAPPPVALSSALTCPLQLVQHRDRCPVCLVRMKIDGAAHFFFQFPPSANRTHRTLHTSHHYCLMYVPALSHALCHQFEALSKMCARRMCLPSTAWPRDQVELDSRTTLGPVQPQLPPPSPLSSLHKRWLQPLRSHGRTQPTR
jgi:hypothetical protein